MRFPSQATMVRDPGFRADGEESLQKFGEAFYRDYAANPSAKMTFGALRFLKSPVSEIPGSHENFKKIKMPEIAAWLSPILKGAYMKSP